MKVKNRTISMLAVILLFIVAAYLFDEWYRFNRNSQLLRQEHSTLVEKVFKGMAKRTTGALKAEANLILRDKPLIFAFENQNRKELAARAKPYLAAIKTIFPGSVCSVNFYLPDGTMFLRTHKPDMFGDDAATSRPIVAAVLDKKKPAAGLEGCSFLIGQRYVHPIYINGNFAGALELSVDVTSITSRVSTLSNIKNAVVINKDTTKVKKCTAEDGSFNPEYMNNTGIPLSGLIDPATHDARPTIKTDSGTYHLIKSIPLIDYSGNNLGKMLFFMKSSSLQEWFAQHIIRSTVICIIGIFLIALVSRRGFIDSIAELEKEHAAALKQLKNINAHLEERIRKEVENCRTKDQIINQQQKVADMGLMLSALAHHWRQPINAVGLYVQDLSEAYKSGELNLAYIEEFEKNNMNLLNKLSDSIDRYRSFFQPSVEKTEFEIISIISEINEMLSASLSSTGIKLTVNCKCPKKEFSCTLIEHMPECEFHETKISGFLNEFKQTLLNIIYNSLDAIRERYAAENYEKRDGEIRISLLVEENTIKITIADNGTGIPDDILDKVFNPFFTTKEEGKGTGIGLYMAKTVIEKYMCGTIAVRNTGKGTEMNISLHKDDKACM